MSIHKISKALLGTLVREYEAGKSAAALSRRHAVGAKGIIAALKRVGVRIRIGTCPTLPPDQVGQMKALYAAGHSIREVASALHVGYDLIRQRLKSEGVPIRHDRRWRFAEEDKQEMARLYLLGWEIGEIAREFGLTRSPILAFLKDRGVAIRPRKVTLPPAEVARVCDLYRECRDGSRVARATGYPVRAVYDALRDGGVDVRNRLYMTEADRDEALRQSLAGKSAAAIARALGVNKSSVRRLQIGHDMPASKRGDFAHKGVTPEQQLEMATLYDGGLTLRQVGKQFGMTRHAVAYHLAQIGCPLRDPSVYHRRYALNQDAFADAATNPVAAYHVGLLMADGCVSAPRGMTPRLVTLGLKVGDAGQIERFRAFLGTDLPAITYKRPEGGFPNSEPVCRLTVTSERLASDLARYGVVPNKTHTAKVVGLEWNRFFWAGAIDGDGSIHFDPTGYPHLSLVGSLALVGQFRNFVHAAAPESRSEVHKHKSIWGIAVNGQSAVQVIALLYQDNPYALARKAERARLAIRWRPKDGYGCWLGADPAADATRLLSQRVPA